MFWGFLAESCRGEETVKKIRRYQRKLYIDVNYTDNYRLHGLIVGEAGNALPLIHSLVVVVPSLETSETPLDPAWRLCEA